MADTQQLKVGAVYLSFDELVRHLDAYAIQTKTSYKVSSRDHRRFLAVCVGHKDYGCPWRLRATFSARTKDVVLTRFNDTHTCPEHLRTQSKVASSVRFLQPLVQREVHANPQCRPADIVRAIEEREGIKVSYMAAYRSRELSRKALYGSEMNAFKVFPQLCHYLKSIDKNCTVDLALDSNNKFCSIFACPSACKAAFLCSRPVVGLRSSPLRGRFPQTLLLALGLDANDNHFILAYALVPVENHDSWAYFLANLTAAVPSLTALDTVLISKRDAGVESAAELLLPSVPHSHCAWHLAEDVCRRFGRGPKDLVGRMARTTKRDKFERLLSEMEAFHSAAAQHVKTCPPPHKWAASFLGGPGKRR